MNPVINSYQVRDVESRWSTENGGSTWGLMIKAAESFVRQFLGSFQHGLVLVVVGNGNNGGDGYYIGKLLLESGVKVVIHAPIGLPDEGIDAYRARQAYIEAGGSVVDDIPEKDYVAIIDALFGIGLCREVKGKAFDVINLLNQMPQDVYSVDIPSGLCAVTGTALPVAVQATATHCFIAYKPGLLTHTGPTLCGKLTLDSLDLDVESDWQRVVSVTDIPERIGNTHKSEHGNVRVIGGQQSMAGAAIIAAQAALNSGAGRVFLHCDKQFFSTALALAPELMIADEIKISSTLGAETYIIGPGLGRSDEAEQIWSAILNNNNCSGVMDADALRLLASAPRSVANWVLTPHEGEAADLLGITSAEVQLDRVQCAIKLADKYSTTVVLKGSGTIVASRQKLVFCHPGSPAMATPGMGDCLAGIIGSLLGQGLSQESAAITGVNWHAILALAISKKQRVVLASDISLQLKNRL